MTMSDGPQRQANIVGLGLIGGSIAKALTARGWQVSATDRDPSRVSRAQQLGIISSEGLIANATITFVAVPVLAVPQAVTEALAATTGFVTDVASVKAGVAAVVDDPRFVGGHPMAGSAQDGLDGADADMFEGTVWVLTPSATTSDQAFATVASIASELGAEVVVLGPLRHDDVVAVVSHVPHLVAATLMNLADQRAEEHTALLRLAAGGFRDMTRVAAGHPAIWLDICEQNRDAIVGVLDGLIAQLGATRSVVAKGERGALESILSTARHARINLPSRVTNAELMAEVRVPIPDRPGAAAEVFSLAADLSVNISRSSTRPKADAVCSSPSSTPANPTCSAAGCWPEGSAQACRPSDDRRPHHAAASCIARRCQRHRAGLEELHQSGAGLRGLGSWHQHARGRTRQ
jgi:prephenate dehydrogenase